MSNPTPTLEDILDKLYDTANVDGENYKHKAHNVTPEAKQQIQALMLELTDQVNKDQFRVDGAVSGNDLISQGFNMYHRAIREKIVGGL